MCVCLEMRSGVLGSNGRSYTDLVATPVRSEEQLSPEDRLVLEAAHRRLREAVAAYEPFLGRELKEGDAVPVHDLEQLAQAQAEIEGAERELWRLRETLLGWPRPTWAPGAALVADWFSVEDAVYDDVSSASGR